MLRSWIASFSTLILFLAAAIGSTQTSSSRTSAAGQPSPDPQPNGAATAASAEDDDGGADIPPLARGRIGEQEYLRLRDQQTGLTRGVDDLARNPQARAQAIRRMEAQEQALRQRRTGQNRRSAGFTPAVTPTLAWTPLGPDPIPNGQTVGSEVAVSGRVTAIAIDPTDATGNTAYVGTAQGGLYRTLDGGSTWTAMMDSAQSLAIGALTLDPTDPTVLFVGTGEGNFSLDSFFGVGLYIVTNANAGFILNGPFNAPTTSPNPDGFTDVFTGRAITKILVNPGNHSQILVSTSSGFSGLSGGSFSTLPVRGVYLSSNVFSSGSTVGAPTFTRLTVQTAAGAANRPVTDMAMDPGNPNLVLVNVFGQSGTEGGIWVSPSTVWSGTGTWTQTMQTALGINGKLAVNHSGSPTAVTTFFAGLGQKPTSGACTADGMLFKAANNGGSSWAEIPAARGFCGGQCFYDMPVAVDPTTTNNIYIGGQAGGNIGACGAGTLGKSVNGGTSFAASQTQLHADSHAIAIHPGNPLIIYTGNDGGIFRSNNGGATWTSLNTAGLNATQFQSVAVHPTDPNFSLGGTQDNGTPLLMPDGVTWNRADFGDGGYSAIDQNAVNTTSVTMYHTYFNATNSMIGYAGNANGVNAAEGTWGFSGCLGTTPGNGINCADTVLFYAPLVLGPGNPNTVYFGTDRLYRSADQGNTHTVVSQAPIVANVPVSAIGISSLTDQVRIVGLGVDTSTGAPNGHVFATTSGTSTLTDVTGPWASRYVARTVIDPNDPNTAYVTLDGYGVTTGHVWKTSNLSATAPAWTSVSSGIPDVPVNGFAVDPQNSNNLYAATDIGVYNSIDGGNSWNPYGTGLPRVAVFDLKVTAKRTVRIATHGRGLWEIAAVSPGIATTISASANPSNPVIGANVTFTAAVNHASGAASPTGTIAFLDGATVLGSSPVNASSTATFSTTTLAGGAHSITAVYGGDSSYAASQGTTQVTLSQGDFALAIPNVSAMVHAGQTAAYTIDVAALNNFTGLVNFSCTSGLPALASCSFNPPAVSMAGTTSLMISTAAPTAAPPASGLNAGGGFTAGFFGLMLFGGMAAGKRRLRRACFFLALLSPAVGLISSCGGPSVTHNPGTPTGTSTITITATSGSIAHTATVTLVVQ